MRVVGARSEGNGYREARRRRSYSHDTETRKGGGGVYGLPGNQEEEDHSVNINPVYEATTDTERGHIMWGDGRGAIVVG